MNAMLLSTNHSLQNPLMCVNISSQGVVKVETYEKDYIIAKKKESYEYLEKKHTEFARKYNNEDGTINKGEFVRSLDIILYPRIENLTYTADVLATLEDLFNYRTKRNWRKIDLYSFVLLEEKLKNDSEIFSYLKKQLKKSIAKNPRRNFTGRVLSYFMCLNYDESDKYVTELIEIYLKAVEQKKYSVKHINKIYPLLSHYIHKHHIEISLSQSRVLNDIVREEVKEFAQNLNHPKPLNKEEIMPEVDKKEEEKTVMKKQSVNKKKQNNLKKDFNQNQKNNKEQAIEQNSKEKNITKEMPNFSELSETDRINWIIKDILNSLDYDKKEELKGKLQELKDWIKFLNESKLFYRQRDELISLDNYEEEENQKQLLKFIDTYLK